MDLREAMMPQATDRAWPLLAASVPGVERIGGVSSPVERFCRIHQPGFTLELEMLA
jgi:hypothetical protein